MPIDLADLPVEVQWAFYIYGLLPDRYEGMSGTYLGKDWASIDAIFKFLEVEDTKHVFIFTKKIEVVTVTKAAEDAKRKSKMAKSSDKNYTYNVSG